MSLRVNRSLSALHEPLAHISFKIFHLYLLLYTTRGLTRRVPRQIKVITCLLITQVITGRPSKNFLTSPYISDKVHKGPRYFQMFYGHTTRFTIIPHLLPEFTQIIWWTGMGSNHHSHKATDLQSAELTIAQPVHVERVRRIELLASAWKAEVLPLYDTRRNWRSLGDLNS